MTTQPAYWAVATLDGRSIDRMLLPHLPRLGVAGIMLSLHYAREVRRRELPDLPVFVDSGGFALLARGGYVERSGAVFDLVLHEAGEGGDGDRITAPEVLAAQLALADVGATLDAPIPPGTERTEAAARLDATLANAAWAAGQPRPVGFRLYGSVQGASVADFAACARTLDALPLEGLAIGGLVPRARDPETLFAIAQAVREATDKPVHAFGIGAPALVEQLGQIGIDSVDSSAPMRAAASGESWQGYVIEDASPMERLRMAVENVAALTGAVVPRPNNSPVLTKLQAKPRAKRTRASTPRKVS